MNTAVVNGKTYSVVRGSLDRGGMDLIGPRGAEYALVQNIHSKRWVLIPGGHMRPKAEPVKTLEVR